MGMGMDPDMVINMGQAVVEVAAEEALLKII